MAKPTNLGSNATWEDIKNKLQENKAHMTSLSTDLKAQINNKGYDTTNTNMSNLINDIDNIPAGGSNPLCELQWSIEWVNNSVQAIAVDTVGNVYVGGVATYFTKYADDGTKVWEMFTSNPTLDIEINDNGSIQSATKSLYTMLPYGASQRNYTGYSGTIYAVGIGPDEGCVIGGNQNGTSRMLRKLTPAYSSVPWTNTNHTNDINDIVVTNDGFVYSVSSDNSLRKTKYSDGVEIYRYGDVSKLNTVDVDKRGYVYTGNNSGTVKKLDGDGTFIWTCLISGTFIQSLKVDDSDNVFAYTDTGKLVKINSEGKEIYRLTVGSGTSYYRKIAIDKKGHIYTANGNDRVINKYKDGGIGQALIGSNMQIIHHTGYKEEGLGDTCNTGWETGIDHSIENVKCGKDKSVFAGTSNGRVYKFSTETGNNTWTKVVGHPNSITLGISVLTDGDVIAGQNDGTLTRLNKSTGDTIWTKKAHASAIENIATDSKNNICSVSADKTIKKWTDGGELVYAFSDLPSEVIAVTFDGVDCIYIGLANGIVSKISQGHLNLWSKQPQTSQIWDICVDDNGLIYTSLDNSKLQCLTSSGDIKWTVALSGWSESCSLDKAGNIYCTDGGSVVRKYNSNGDPIWSYNNLETYPLEVTTDENGCVYTGGTDNKLTMIIQNSKIRKYVYLD